MGSEKSGSEVLQDASLRRKDLIGTRKLEGASETGIALMITAHLCFLQKEKRTLPTFTMWMDARFASTVEM